MAIYFQLSYGASTGTTTDYNSSRYNLWAALDAWELEEKAKQMSVWKEPKKRIPVPTVQVMRKYENRFKGRKFPVGGPKK